MVLLILMYEINKIRIIIYTHLKTAIKHLLFNPSKFKFSKLRFHISIIFVASVIDTKDKSPLTDKLPDNNVKMKGFELSYTL